MPPERPAGDFGRKLREARERRGISLRQIANATKISVVALEALERNDVSRLPGGIFSRAFVRSYALEVGLEPEQAIQEFIAQFPQDSVTAGHAQADHIEDNEALESDRRMAMTFLRIIAVSIPIAGLVLYFGTRKETASEDAPSAPPAVTATTAPDHAPDPVVSAPLAGADAALAPEAEAPPPAFDPSPGVLTVGLTARRECWVSASVDGKKTIERLLQPGEQASMEIRRELVITAGDASAITLTLNGARARPLGGDGEVVTARVNPNNFKEYLLTR